jgi:hypothetical protein
MRTSDWPAAPVFQRASDQDRYRFAPRSHLNGGNAVLVLVHTDEVSQRQFSHNTDGFENDLEPAREGAWLRSGACTPTRDEARE